jgi:vitamin B12 transporter
MRRTLHVILPTSALLLLTSALLPARALAESPSDLPGDEAVGRPPGPDDPTPPPAEDESSPADTDQNQPPVFYETTTVTARPVSSATGAVTVIDAEDLASSEARSGSEILGDVPGLKLLPTGGRAGVTHAWIRGADPNFTLVLLDGIPINDPTDQQGGAFNLEEIPGVLVDRAEIVRGPQTSFYGMSALSGVVQLFTPRGKPGPVEASAGAEVGNADLRHAFASASGGAGEGGWSVGANYDEEKHRIARDRFRQLDAWATTDLHFGSDADLDLTARFATGDQHDYANGSGGPELGSGEVRRTDHDDLALGARLFLGDPDGPRHELIVGLSHRSQDRLSPAIPPVVPSADESTTYTHLRVAWQVPLHRSGRTHVDLGASADGEWAGNESLLLLPPELGGAVTGDYDDSRLSGGIFGALRHERGAFLYEAALRVDGASGLGVRLNPQLGVVWSPGPGTTRLRASAGTATKLPSFFALASPPALGGNPDLKPEHTLGGEIGLEHDVPSASLSLGASAFLNEYRELVDFDFDRFLHVNRGRVRTAGIELTARWQPHPTLRLAAEATWLRARDLAAESPPLLYEPRWRGGGSLTWQPSPRLSLQADVRAVSPYLDHQIPVPDRDTVAGYGLLGFAGSWTFHKGWKLRARLDNATGHTYETLIGFPGPGRSFWLGVGWDRS